MYVTSQFCYWMVRNCQNGYEFHKSRFAVDRSGKLVFLTDYNNVKKGHSVVFFILYGKRWSDRNLTMKTFKMF